MEGNIHWLYICTGIFTIILLSYSVISIAEDSPNLFSSNEIYSPSDWIKEDQIKVYNNKIVLEIFNSTWAKFTNTNSMDPFIDESANAIEILPDDPDMISIGDVISYQTIGGIVIHRVIDKGYDNKGIFYTVKGDNNSFKDPFKVRYEDIKGVVVAVIY